MRAALAGLLLLLAILATAGADNPTEADRQPISIPGKQRMPEFADIAEWVHSKPLRAADLRGKVVVVHFMAFG